MALSPRSGTIKLIEFERKTFEGVGRLVGIALASCCQCRGVEQHSSKPEQCKLLSTCRSS